MTIILAYIPFVVGTLTLMLMGIVVVGNLLPVDLMASSIAALDAYIAVMKEILPLTTVALLSLFASLFTLEYFFAAYKGVKWLYSKLPGVS